MIVATRKHEDCFYNLGLTLNIESRDRNQKKGNEGNKSKSRNDRSKSKSSQHHSKKDIECWNCGKNGHYKNECRVAKNDKNGDSKTSANVVLKELDDVLIYFL